MERISFLIDNKRISVLKGSRERIFYIHGSGGDAEIWKNQLMDLGGYAIDLPKHGKSENAEIRSVDDYAYFVAEIVKKIAGKAIVVGHSLGGAVAQKVYLNHKEIVESLVLVGEHDLLTPLKYSEFFAKYGAELKVIKNAGRGNAKIHWSSMQS